MPYDSQTDAFRQVLRTFTLSLYASTLRSTDRSNVSSLHDLKTILTSTTHTHGMPPLASIHRGFCTITSFISLRHIMVGSTPSNVFVIARNCTRIALLYTRATWMWLDMISLGNWALACNFETYRYFLPSAHMPFLLSCIYTISLLWPGTSSQPSLHPLHFHIQLILHLSTVIFLSLTISWSTIQ